MPNEYESNFARGHRFRLETLIKIRWLAVAGQTTAVLITAFFLRYEFPMAMCLFAIACSAWLNIFLRLRYPISHRLNPTTAIILLAYDILQLALLLFLTGGLQNPFAFLLVVPVIISATVQTILQTILLSGLVIVVASLLAFIYLPLPWNNPGHLQLPLLYIAGVWTAIVASLTFTALYVFRVADESRKLADALAATELVLQREQHLTKLDGLAAAAAHELGTPLATIALVSKEMTRELKEGDSLMEDAQLLRSQAERCREILNKLSSLSEEGEDHLGHLKLSSMVEEISAPHRDFGIDLTVKLDGKKPEPVLPRNPAILYGLGNLVENAVDFAKSKVTIHAKWGDEEVSLEIGDDGKGFDTDLLERIGEPFVTTRDRTNAETGGGLGLGLFIAKTLLERSGAVMKFESVAEPLGGAKVSITWPKTLLQQPANKIQLMS